MNLLDIAKQYVNGAETLKDWLGSGGEVVSHEEAERRSLVCLTCPENLAANWLERNITHPAAKFIKAQLELKKNVRLQVINEDDIHFCRACGCSAKLKIWVPIEHIAAHTSIETLAKTPDRCWYKKAIIHGI